MRKRVFVIIGEGQSGKSSLVRALTGVYRSSRIDVQLIDETLINIMVWPKSAQEPPVVVPNQLLANINATQAPEVLIVLRPFGAKEYIELIASQHDIVQVVLISKDSNVPQVRTPGIQNPLDNSKKRPRNANAAKVRGWWGWL